MGPDLPDRVLVRERGRRMSRGDLYSLTCKNKVILFAAGHMVMVSSML